MYSVIASLAAGVAVAVLFRVTFVQSWWGVILPGLLAVVGAAVLFFRWSAKKLEPVLKQVESHLKGNRREMALKALKDALDLGKWNPLLPAQINASIGIMQYVNGELDDAIVTLSKATRYSWEAHAYLGCAYFKKHDRDNTPKAFEKALKAEEKQGILYTLYAHCLIAQGKRDEAVKVLERGLLKIPGDNRLENNIELAKEGKKLKTAPYGEQWTRFGLEGPVVAGPPQLPKGMRGYAPRPGFRQRPTRKR